MLNTFTTMAQSTSASSSGLPSPTEALDDNSNKLTTYLRQLAGNYEMDVDIIVKDHCYAKPWNWKPENNYAKPVKKLFFSKNTTISSKHRKDEEINVVDIDDKPLTLPFDLTKAQNSMDEFQRLVSNVRLEEDEDWEEKIDKTLWSSVQNRIFSKVTRILNTERLARLSKTKTTSEPIFRRMSIDIAARQFRETLASIVWDWRLAQWLHNLLFEHLSQEYLIIYLDILQSLRQKIPQLIDKMIAVQPNIITKAGSITWETLGSYLKRSWDPVASSLNGIKLELPGNPILIVVPFGITSTGITSSISMRQQKWIAQLRMLGTVFAFHNYNHNHNHIGLAANRMTMMVCIDQLVQATRAKLQSIRSEYPGRPIVLVGFNTGAALACQIAQMEHVNAVICIGFPFTTVEGKRGTPDDMLMDLRCPVMFIIGQNATLVRPDDLEDLREKMMVETSLVIVGTADDYLRISTSKKMLEGITQSMVDRYILDEIGDFIGSILLQPNPLPLRPTISTNCDNKNKKESLRRRNSTSSSVESEPNSPIVKKSRPNSPISSAMLSVGMNATTSLTPKVNTQITPVQGSVQHANHTSAVRRKRPANNQKNQLPEHLKTARVTGQTNIAAENGLTLNIGSLASLAPIGPIRLAPSTASQSATTMSKASNVSRSSATSAKVPKIISNVPLQGTKIKTLIPANKSYSNVVSSNFRHVNASDKNADTKLVNVITAGSQIRINTNSGAGSGKPVATTSATLSNLLQSGKNPAPLTSTTSSARVSSASSILLTTTSSPTNNVTPSTSTVSKATEEMGMSCDSQVLDIPKSAYVPRQETAPSNTDNNTSCSNIVIVENSLHNRSAPSVIVPLNNQSSGGVLPISNKLKVSHKSVKTMPKITVNATNLQRLQKAKPQNIQKTIANDLDDDLGNILDIPIIFAKDDDNLNNIDKIPVVTQTALIKDPQERPKLNSTTKVVLISNKQDNKLQQTPSKIGATSTPAVICPNMTVQNLNQLILQTQSQNNSIPAKSRIGMPLENRLMQPVKYTKIILAKRSTQIAQQNEQVILTKNTEDASAPKILTFKDDYRCVQTQSSKTSSSYDDSLADDVLEIEDAIKTNIIERKYTPAPTIEETSPSAVGDNDCDVLNKVDEKKHASLEESAFDSASKVK
ncbi:KAT8 regulatory NSL complex subunit 3 isoform X3 [Pseudomyrmex gracilis]|uniref:KAT8 regulatory NSL complex subunit 3 isoform X3 n=1 Tax=Pseudomyrmex gracilis TaxID=219809 RepID=UPI0009952F38|nr:KAT8 regulatory NSL complex subunit 3 isoform X3 [Pseudomyrmex gracilis]